MAKTTSHDPRGDPGRLRQRAGEQPEQRGAAPEGFSRSDREQLTEELRIHQVELEMQNEELREREEELLVSRNRYQDLWELAPVSYLLLDRAGRIDAVNLAGRALFARSESELLRERFLYLVVPRDQVTVQLLLEQAWLAGSGEDREVRLVQPDGSVRVCQLSCRIAMGVQDHLQAVLTDITARNQAEAELRRAQDRLEHLVEERTAELAAANRELSRRAGQLARLSSELTLTEQRERRRLADMMHENLQQYLVGVRMNLEVLSSRIGSEQQGVFRSAYDLLQQSIEVCRTLTTELAPPVLRRQGLASALRWLADWMREKWYLEVELDIAPRANVYSEDVAMLLFQSVREMMINVRKHAGTSVAWLSLGRDSQGRVEIVVRDRGVGCRMEDMERENCGVGLFSIRERLELLGGRMQVRSAPGEGTEIRLTVPVGEEGPVGGETAESLPPPPPAGNGGPRRIRVVLVDDHPILRESLTPLIQQYGDIEVVGEAASGEDAVRLAGELQPDVILMDISMPGMDGIEATEIIHAAHPAIRIIGLSMHDQQAHAELMLAAGAVAYCAKTGDTATLIAAIRGG